VSGVEHVARGAILRTVDRAGGLVSLAGEILTVVVLLLSVVDELIRTRPRLAAEIGESLELKRSQAQARLDELGVSKGVLGDR